MWDRVKMEIQGGRIDTGLPASLCRNGAQAQAYGDGASRRPVLHGRSLPIHEREHDFKFNSANQTILRPDQ